MHGLVVAVVHAQLIYVLPFTNVGHVVTLQLIALDTLRALRYVVVGWFVYVCTLRYRWAELRLR